MFAIRNPIRARPCFDWLNSYSFKKSILNNGIFKSRLEELYELITTHDFSTPQQARNACASFCLDLFNEVDFELVGSENLPEKGGNLFLYNHLHNPIQYALKDNFHITLDSHFLSAYLFDYYNDPGMRIVRYSLPHEQAHKKYYSPFDFIKVYASGFRPHGLSQQMKVQSKSAFYQRCLESLSKGQNLIISPEGTSNRTEQSPSPFRFGVFKLAQLAGPDLNIVPVVFTGFDRPMDRAAWKCAIKKPFRLGDVVKDPFDINQIAALSDRLFLAYKKWVPQLRQDNQNFAREIELLKRRIKRHSNKKDLVCFYGSSSIRLWDLNKSFRETNTLNLGFGGAFIDSCLTHFEALFKGLNPKKLVLYVGENDLTSSTDKEMLVSKFERLITHIRGHLKNTEIICISVKPSPHRAHHIDLVREINAKFKSFLATLPNTQWVDIFTPFVGSKGQIQIDYFGRDRLHLNQKGYAVWDRALRSVLIGSQTMAS